MKKRTLLLAGAVGILDLVLIALTVGLLAGAPKQKEAAAGIAAVSEKTETTKDQYTSSYKGVIKAQLSTTPEPTPTPTPEPTPIPTPTPTPTPEPTPEPHREMDPADFIFPNSSTEALDAGYVSSVVTSKAQCQRAVNEIFARHGYQFHREKNAADYDYFNSLGWYQAMSKVDSATAVEATFNAVEKANIDLLLQIREGMNG